LPRRSTPGLPPARTRGGRFRDEVGEGVEWLVLGHFTASAKRLRAAHRPAMSRAAT
jgi:hypothetical protein